MALQVNKNYVNGTKASRKEGDILTFYFKNGKVKAEGLYISEKMEGEWKFFRETGQLWAIGNFINSLRNGPWVRFDKNDQVEYDEVFENDKVIRKKKK